MTQWVLDFAAPGMAPWIGGDIGDPETNGTDEWRWLGANPCWAILPPDFRDSPFRAELIAAPFAPYQTELMLLTATDSAGHTSQAYQPAGVRSSLALDISRYQGPTSVRWEIVPPPTLTLSVVGSHGVTLEYDRDDRFQSRAAEKLGPASVGAGDAPAALLITPAYGLAESHGTNRILSFRLQRLVLTRV